MDFDDGDCQTSDSLTIAQKNYNKVVEKAKTMGYREGIAEGKESVYQESFNKGYEVGFKSGKDFGVYRGIIEAMKKFDDLNPDQKTILKSIDTDRDCTSRMENSGRTLCLVCNDELLLNQSIEEVAKQQSLHCEDSLQHLEQKCGSFITDHYKLT